MADISMRESFGRALAAYGEKNLDVVVLDVDTAASTMSKFFAERFPDRFINVGIAEPCMVDVAAGLALGGKIPFANGFAALVALRALEQVRTCLCYAYTDVKLASSYAGLSDYKDGPTHHAISDIAVMRSIPGMTVIVPGDAQEAARWIPIIAEYRGPIYFRLSRAPTLLVPNETMPLEIGKALEIRPGTDVCIIATGSMVGLSLKAASLLSNNGIQACVLEVHTIKPLDEQSILTVAQKTRAIVTAEEHSIVGGLGGAVAQCLCGRVEVAFESIGIKDTFAATAPSVEALMDAYGLSVAEIIAATNRVTTQKKIM